MEPVYGALDWMKYDPLVLKESSESLQQQITYNTIQVMK